MNAFIKSIKNIVINSLVATSKLVKPSSLANIISLILPRLSQDQTAHLISEIIHRYGYDESFQLWEKHGFHITPLHFHSPIPDSRSLQDRIWEKPTALVGVNLNETQQLNLLDTFQKNYKTEYSAFPLEKTEIPYQFYLNNGSYTTVDAEVLYCMVRHFQPQRIIEIGSGNSTLLTAQAIQKNESLNDTYSCNFTAIEPYPNPTLQKGFPGLSQLLISTVEEIPFSTFEELQENDLLIIDSSHILQTGSDVQYEYLEILPRLQKGVIVHVHDIFLPAEYPKEWVKKKHVFWNEQYILQAFLAFNTNYETIFANSYLHHQHPEKLSKVFDSYSPTNSMPGSYWIKRTR